MVNDKEKHNRFSSFVGGMLSVMFVTLVAGTIKELSLGYLLSVYFGLLVWCMVVNYKIWYRYME